MIKVSMFFGDPCAKCGHAKLNVIKELGLSKYECECENCKSVIIVDKQIKLFSMRIRSDNMIGEYSSEKCPKCGGNMIIKNEVHTFDGTVVNCKCENCEYIITYEE